MSTDIDGGSEMDGDIDADTNAGIDTGSDGVPCVLMRGGTSKGAYFLASDLPADPEARDDLLLRLLGSPDPRQIDGIGGGHPLASKVAVVSRCPDPAIADVDYLFLQVHVDRPLVTADQPCGNILAGIGPFAAEKGLCGADGTGRVRIRMVNTGGVALATFGFGPNSGPNSGSGVRTVDLEFQDTAGSVCGSLLPTGRPRDEIDGIPVTCMDNGMPVVMVAARDLGITGYESCAELEADTEFARRRETLRLSAGRLMGLGDVSDTTIPKITLIAPPREGGTLATRTFIPHRCHTSIGVLGAVTVATGASLPGSVADGIAAAPSPDGLVRIEHPTGFFDTRVAAGPGGATTAAVVRTARKLFAGTAWPRPADLAVSPAIPALTARS
jgi:4-oxalomesaconate tautomerase